MTSKATLGILMLLALSAPYMVLAASYTAPSLWPTGYWATNGLISCTGNYINGSNPCTNLCDLIGTLVNIIYFGMTLAIFIVAPVLFVAGGIMIMLSGPKPEMLSQAKKMLTGTVVGLMLILGSYFIVNTTINVLGISGVGGFGGNAACSTPQ